MSGEQEISRMEEGGGNSGQSARGRLSGFCSSAEVVQLTQKVIAEGIGTYFLVFAGCGAVAVNKIYGSISFPGVAVVWGLIVMVMIYSVGHISGGHLNPAVSVTFAIFRHFPLKQLPLYIAAQVVGAILASGTLCLIFDVNEDAYFGTIPVGSNGQSFVIEIIASFLLMFVISGVATDNRAVGELAGIAIGMTILIDVFVAGPVSGASMNPARSIGPAVVMNIYKGLWVYIVGPFIGTILGGFTYNLIRFTDKPLKELTKSASIKSAASILKSVSRSASTYSRNGN